MIGQGANSGPISRALDFSKSSGPVAGLKQDFVVRTFFGSTLRRSSATLKNLAIAALSIAVMAVYSGNASSASAKPRYAGIVIDAKSGRVLYARNAEARRYPASLTKMMTLYLVFEDLKRGKIKKSTRIVMTRHAANQPPSKLGLKPGKTFSVEQGIYALVTKSANDVATAIGEKLAGSEKAFARRMTRKARQLGMTRTVFKNANGLPNRAQFTTAHDMARLGLALREHFPRKFRYFKTKSFKYGRRRYPNHNRLLGRIKGVDGIKTGYTRASGFNLVSSVSRSNRRIVAVVMGGKTGRARNAQMARLIGRYLPKATRGRSRILIARAKAPKKVRIAKTVKKPAVPVLKAKAINAPIITARAILPTPKPVRKAGAPNTSRVVTAYQTSMSAPASRGNDEIRNQLIKLASTSMPMPSPRPSVIDPIRTGSVSKSKQLAMAAGNARHPNSWQIQIGATPTRNSAQNLLSNARTKARTLLASTSDYMETVVKGSSTLYRARFAGFPSKGSARRACRILKKRKFDCLAIKP